MEKAILASLLATIMGTSPVWAADSATAAPTAAATAQVQKEIVDVLQVAVQDADAIRDTQFAHLAPFRDQPESAKKLTDDVATLLAADNASWVKSVKTDVTAKMVADRYVVINATVALFEDYMTIPEGESVIKSASEKLAKDDQKGATDTLRLASIGVIENQYLIPLNRARKVVAQAQKLLKAGKYYGANLVLEGAEEDIVMDSKTLVAGN